MYRPHRTPYNVKILLTRTLVNIYGYRIGGQSIGVSTRMGVHLSRYVNTGYPVILRTIREFGWSFRFLDYEIFRL